MSRVWQGVSSDHTDHGKQSRLSASSNKFQKQLLVGNMECPSLNQEVRKTFTAPSTHFILVTCHRAELFQQGSSIIYCQHVGWGTKKKARPRRPK